MTSEQNPADDRERRADEVIAAYLEALAASQAPDRQELLARYPDLADELASFFADHDRAQQWAQPFPLAPPTGLASSTVEFGKKLAPPLGTVVRYFGDYELLEEIARGGMGVVFKARQVSLNRLVALKMILAGPLAAPADIQ